MSSQHRFKSRLFRESLLAEMYSVSHKPVPEKQQHLCSPSSTGCCKNQSAALSGRLFSPQRANLLSKLILTFVSSGNSPALKAPPCTAAWVTTHKFVHSTAARKSSLHAPGVFSTCSKMVKGALIRSKWSFS